MSIEIANESGVDIDEVAVVGVARFALDYMRVSPLAELSVLLVDTETMSELHERWMDLPGPTDVMAFPMDELGEGGVTSAGRPDNAPGGPALLGDVVLCPEFAARQADRVGHSLDAELHVLTVHGVLHLLGYDHADAAEEQEMFALQDQILVEFDDATRAEARRLAQRDADSRVLGVVGLEEPPTTP